MNLRIGIRLPEGGSDVKQTLDIAVSAEEHELDSVWLGEHHGYDTYWPSPHFVLMAIAARTTTIRLGTNVVILPLVQPVRFAGEWSLLEQLAPGRTALGVGVGWDVAEFVAFGQSTGTRGVDTNEALDLMRELWSGSPSNSRIGGRVLDQFRLSPGRPISPPILVGGRSRAAMVRAATRGSGWFPDAALSESEVAEGFRFVEATAADTGRPPPTERPLVRHLVLGRSTEYAEAAAREHFGTIHRLHLERGNPMVNQVWEDFDAWMAQRVILGDLDACTERLASAVHSTGATEIVLKPAGADAGLAAIATLRRQVLSALG